MSIHELDFDPQGNVVGSRCIDNAIQQALDATNGRLPGIETEEHIPSAIDPEFVHTPTIVRKLIAETPSRVRAQEFVMGKSVTGNFTFMPIYDRAYDGEQINKAHLRIGNKGLAYSETEVYTPVDSTSTKTA